jgi:CRP-like cAMP-binding protein
MEQNGKVMHAAQQALDTHQAFGDLLSAEEKQYLMDRGVVRSASPGEILCRRQQLDTRVYVIIMGEVEVSDGDGAQRVVLARLGSGEIFGEISALFHIPRVSDVIVSHAAVLLEIPGDILERVINQRAALREAIIQRYQRRLADTALRSVALFRHLDADRLAHLVEEAGLVSVPAGMALVNEQEQGDALYIIISGTARVSHQINGETLNVALLRTGDYFGEWSLLTGAPRAASVTALSRVEVLRVDCSLFLEFIQNNPEIRDRIDQVAHNRHAGINTGVALDGVLLNSEIEQLELLLKNPG